MRDGVTTKGGQSFVSLRLFEADLMMLPRDPYTEIKTYPVTFVSDQIEFDGVRYKLTKAGKAELDRFLHLLRTVPLEIANNFVGVWELNRGESPHFDSHWYNPIPVYETLVIEQLLVLREGSGIKVGGTAGDGLTISTYI